VRFTTLPADAEAEDIASELLDAKLEAGTSNPGPHRPIIRGKMPVRAVDRISLRFIVV
jgi:hypothetical protein